MAVMDQCTVTEATETEVSISFSLQALHPLKVNDETPINVKLVLSKPHELKHFFKFECHRKNSFYLRRLMLHM